MIPTWAEMPCVLLFASHLTVAFLFLAAGFRMGRARSAVLAVNAVSFDPGKPEEENLMETDPFNRAAYSRVKPTMPEEKE